jgi:hypothetical protein
MNESTYKTCGFCNKVFTTKRNCLNHISICKIKKQIEYDKTQNKVDELQNKIKNLENELLKKDEQIKYQKIIIQNYENNNKKCSKQVNNTQTNSNNITIFNTTQTLKDLLSCVEPINFQEIKNSVKEKFNNNYIDKGIEGFATFLCDHPCKNKIITTDFSRGIIAYKTSDQDIVRDPEAIILMNKTIKDNADVILEKTEQRHNFWIDQINDCIDQDIQPEKTDIENKNLTKRLIKTANDCKKDIQIKSLEAANIIKRKTTENIQSLVQIKENELE